jgi:hypothetical protein
VAVLPYPEERKITQAADIVRRPVHHHHPDKWHHIPDSAAFQRKDNCRPPGQTDTIPGSYSGEAAMREQCNRGGIAPSSVPSRKASDVKAAGMPEPSHAGRR